MTAEAIVRMTIVLVWTATLRPGLAVATVFLCRNLKRRFSRAAAGGQPEPEPHPYTLIWCSGCGVPAPLDVHGVGHQRQVHLLRRRHDVWSEPSRL